MATKAEREAWEDYLRCTRGQSDVRYEEIESWAWSKLQQRLRAVKARRKKLTTV